MTRYKMTMAYDGHLFHGFQKQLKQRTVQETVEKALYKMTKGIPVAVFGSGRTDAGVHAKGQVIHFDFPGNMIAPERMIRALNSLMPLDIVFIAGEIVTEDFHVQYSAQGKWYQYRVSLDRFTDPFKRFYTGHYGYPLDVELIKAALPDIVGTHDFTSFAASGGVIKDKVRTIYYANVHEDQVQNELIFDFVGNGFLYNMVRILVATSLEIGNGRRPVDDFQRLIAIRDRNEARGTAPASGLYLKEVYYDEIPEKFRADFDKSVKQD